MAPKKDPYCEFKSDRERLLALIARDIRLVMMTAIAGYSGHLAWPVLQLLFRIG